MKKYLVVVQRTIEGWKRKREMLITEEERRQKKEEKGKEKIK